MSEPTKEQIEALRDLQRRHSEMVRGMSATKREVFVPWDQELHTKYVRELISLAPALLTAAQSTAPADDGWRKLATFVKWAITEGPFDGCNLDGADIQEKAANLGILIRTKYDPEKHGPNADAEPGDQWFEFAPWLSGKEGGT